MEHRNNVSLALLIKILESSSFETIQTRYVAKTISLVKFLAKRIALLRIASGTDGNPISFRYYAIGIKHLYPRA